MAEVAEALGVSTSTIRRLVASGALAQGTHYWRVGPQYRLRLDRVLVALEAGRHPTLARPAVSDAILADLE